MGVPFFRTNRIKRTFINYEDFHGIIIVDKFCSFDFIPGVILLLISKQNDFKLIAGCYTRTRYFGFSNIRRFEWVAFGMLANTLQKKQSSKDQSDGRLSMQIQFEITPATRCSHKYANIHNSAWDINIKHEYESKRVYYILVLYEFNMIVHFQRKPSEDWIWILLPLKQ